MFRLTLHHHHHGHTCAQGGGVRGDIPLTKILITPPPSADPRWKFLFLRSKKETIFFGFFFFWPPLADRTPHLYDDGRCVYLYFVSGTTQLDRHLARE